MAISIAPASRRSCRAWSSKQYILAALAGTLAVIAIVSVVSVLLCPAHIYFYLTDTTYGLDRGNYTDHFNFTIVANNTSRLTQVQYREMKVEVWFAKTSWLPATVDTSAYPSWQQPRNTTKYGVFSNVTEYEKTNLPPPPPQESQKKSDNGRGDNDEDRYPEVVIKAKVRFRYGHAGTRLYNIVVSCPSVNFTDEGDTGRRGINYLPVNCTA